MVEDPKNNTGEDIENITKSNVRCPLCPLTFTHNDLFAEESVASCVIYLLVSLASTLIHDQTQHLRCDCLVPRLSLVLLELDPRFLNNLRATSSRKMASMNAWRDELNKSTAHPSINDSLDLLVGPITEIAEGPASIRQHICITMKQKPRQNRKAGRHTGEVWGRVFSPTQVTEGPYGIASHGETSGLTEESGRKCFTLN
ncbi:hypothetical protein E2C01_009624 [Portunus trituberculatus]|uniref:Uncharacterized protein n=1 Tax=Portunus trituberculatus TaxID=210409 RepID=A0A5B7D696_PORTR|nr:hypothetical protein [Portunus trituberculatus]